MFNITTIMKGCGVGKILSILLVLIPMVAFSQVEMEYLYLFDSTYKSDMKVPTMIWEVPSYDSIDAIGAKNIIAANGYKQLKTYPFGIYLDRLDCNDVICNVTLKMFYGRDFHGFIVRENKNDPAQLFNSLQQPVKIFLDDGVPFYKFTFKATPDQIISESFQLEVLTEERFTPAETFDWNKHILFVVSSSFLGLYDLTPFGEIVEWEPTLNVIPRFVKQ